MGKGRKGMGRNFRNRLAGERTGKDLKDSKDLNHLI